MRSASSCSVAMCRVNVCTAAIVGAAVRHTALAQGRRAAGGRQMRRSTVHGAARQSGSRGGAHVAAVQDQPVVRVRRDRARAPLPAGPLRPSAASRPAPGRCGCATRKMCVSTAIVGSPKATLSTTLAVLRPTPGSACSASRVARHLAAVPLDRMRQVSIRCLALVRYRPIVRMCSRQALRRRARASSAASARPGTARAWPC